MNRAFVTTEGGLSNDAREQFWNKTFLLAEQGKQEMLAINLLMRLFPCEALRLPQHLLRFLGELVELRGRNLTQRLQGAKMGNLAPRMNSDFSIERFGVCPANRARSGIVFDEAFPKTKISQETSRQRRNILTKNRGLATYLTVPKVSCEIR